MFEIKIDRDLLKNFICHTYHYSRSFQLKVDKVLKQTEDEPLGDALKGCKDEELIKILELVN